MQNNDNIHRDVNKRITVVWMKWGQIPEITCNSQIRQTNRRKKKKHDVVEVRKLNEFTSILFSYQYLILDGLAR